MTRTSINTLSPIEREFILFLWNYSKETSNIVIPINDIEEFIQTPEGKEGLRSFKGLKQPQSTHYAPQRVGAFL